jgi:Ion channel
MRVKYKARYVYRIINLIIFALTLTYFCGCFWYMISEWNPFGYEESFAMNTKKTVEKPYHRLIVCCYFALTTLSTVGYGDLRPLNNLEKIFAIVLMIVGIAFFSYIMGNFNDVLITYDEKMGVIDRGSDLQVWLTNLSKFTS